LLEEILIVVNDPKFEFTEDEVKEVRDILNEKSNLVITHEKIAVCRDPKDNPVLECAVAGNADCIVTGDKDLLSLKSFRKISILTPREFLRIYNL
jgi:putative PIN family toxin of toxin-antitoxin system